MLLEWIWDEHLLLLFKTYFDADIPLAHSGQYRWVGFAPIASVQAWVVRGWGCPNKVMVMRCYCIGFVSICCFVRVAAFCL